MPSRGIRNQDEILDNIRTTNECVLLRQHCFLVVFFSSCSKVFHSCKCLCERMQSKTALGSKPSFVNANVNFARLRKSISCYPSFTSASHHVIIWLLPQIHCLHEIGANKETKPPENMINIRTVGLWSQGGLNTCSPKRLQLHHYVHREKT